MSLPAKSRAVFLRADGEWGRNILRRVYSGNLRSSLDDLVVLDPESRTLADIDAGLLRDVQIIFSTWGMPALEPASLDKLPALRAVFYAAGSVQHFARPVLERDIAVFSAWAANAIPVAEFTLAQIILGLKQVWPQSRALKELGRPAWTKSDPPGAYGSTVALLSLGMIGRRVAQLLRAFDVRVIAYEPYPKPGLAAELNVELVSLDDCFRRGDVVSLHIPNLPSTRGMITADHVALMKRGTTLINTSRNAVIDSDGILRLLEVRRDLTFVCDVTDPAEPPPDGSLFYRLPNVMLTPHIAGSVGGEVARLGDFMIDEASRFLSNSPLRYRVSEDMLDKMA
jgi:phosphoglycerate dehydrogenase-like enzyme